MAVSCGPVPLVEWNTRGSTAPARQCHASLADNRDSRFTRPRTTVMKRPLLAYAAVALASCASVPSSAPSVSAALRSEFAPTGTLRVGVNFGNPVIAQQDPAGG